MKSNNPYTLLRKSYPHRKLLIGEGIEGIGCMTRIESLKRVEKNRERIQNQNSFVIYFHPYNQTGVIVSITIGYDGCKRIVRDDREA